MEGCKEVCLVATLFFIQDDFAYDWFLVWMVLKYELLSARVFGYAQKKRCQHHCAVMVRLPPFPGQHQTEYENSHDLPQFTQPFHSQ
jgi:hypothetical protein